MDLLKAILFLLVLLNPFLMVVYLVEMVQTFDLRRFSATLIRAGVVSFLVFALFAVLGDVIFEDVLQARFASLQVFGGIVFLIIGLRFVFQGDAALVALRGAPEAITGAIVMPIMIGPGTISAAILISHRLSALNAVLAIFLAVMTTIIVLILLKVIHDRVHTKNERLVARYTEVMGRVTALVVGTFSIELIMQGLLTWLNMDSA